MLGKETNWKAVYGTIIAGVILRGVFFTIKADAYVRLRPEVVTPISAFHRLEESVFLYKHGRDPYAGDVFHQPPLVLVALQGVCGNRVYACVFFTCIDALIALGFGTLCHYFAKLNDKVESTLWLNQAPLSPLFSNENLPATITAMYLFNPFSVASTLSMSTSILTYLTIVWSFCFGIQNKLAYAMFSLAIATYLSIYPIVLAIPLVLLAQKSYYKVNDTKPCRKNTLKCGTSVLLLFSWIAGLLYLSKVFMNGWGFLQETYMWILQYPDLTPNVGVFWYFFMEVFNRFRSYFLLLLHFHPVLYILPLYIRLRTRPLAFACILQGIFTFFQAFPTLGDFGFFFSFCMMHPKTVMAIGNKFVFGVGFTVAAVMLPVMWFVWLFRGSGNANFFYNQTLVYQLFNSMFLVGFVQSTMKRDKNILEYWKYQLTTDN